MLNILGCFIRDWFGYGLFTGFFVV